MSRRRAFCQYCGTKLENDVCPACQVAPDEELRVSMKDVQNYLDYHEEILSEVTLAYRKNILELLVRNLPKEGPITAKVISKALQQKKVSRRSLKRTYFPAVIVFYKWFLGKRHPFIEELRDYRGDMAVPEEEEKEIDKKDFEKFFRFLDENYQIFLWLVKVTTARRTAACNINLEDIAFYYRCRKCKKKEGSDVLDCACKLPEYALVADITRYEKWGGEHAKKEVTVTLTPKQTKELIAVLDIRRARELSFLERKKARGKDEEGNSLYFIDKKGRYLCWNEFGDRIKPRAATNYFGRKSRALGIKITPHNGRHLGISERALAGISLPTLRKTSGHAKGSSIIHRYIHISKEEATKESLEKQMEEEESEE